MWFDHHISEEDLGAPMAAFSNIKGKFGLAPSAARLIYEYYGGDSNPKISRFKELIEATDKIDSAQLTQEDVVDPQGYVLLAYTDDPRTSLKGLDLQAYFIMMVDWLKTKPLDEILEIPDVRHLVDRIRSEDIAFREALLKHSRLEGNVVITDFRGMQPPAGNRFLVYILFPQSNVSARLYDAKGGLVSTIAVGHSIFNRTCQINVGKLLGEYGGGGHKGAGTAQIAIEEADAKFAEIIQRLKDAG